MKTLLRITTVVLLALMSLCIGATEATPSVQLPELKAYLVTCSPGTEAYEVYGHTALRICEQGRDDNDAVFNYGVFSFNARGFIWRWLLGDTDYTVEILPYQVFCDFYGGQGRTITEQRLNLSQEEIRRLAASVSTDLHKAREEGWTYRYNFFYDNCTTRVLDAIELSLETDAHIEWPQPEEQSLRQMLHQFATPWLAEGQDFLIGTEVDESATLRQQLFSPIWASHYASQATIVRTDGSSTPLVVGPTAALPNTDTKNPLTLPFCIAGLFILAAIIFKRSKGWNGWQLRMVIHILQGVIGTLVAFLFLFSTHPAVDSNWLLSAFNPLWFVAAWYVWHHRGKAQGLSGWLYIACTITTTILMIAGKIVGQDYPLTAVLLHIYLLFCLPTHDKTK